MQCFVLIEFQVRIIDIKLVQVHFLVLIEFQIRTVHLKLVQVHFLVYTLTFLLILKELVNILQCL